MKKKRSKPPEYWTRKPAKPIPKIRVKIPKWKDLKKHWTVTRNVRGRYINKEWEGSPRLIPERKVMNDS